MINDHQLIDDKAKKFNLPNFYPTKRARDVLTYGRILRSEENPQELLARVITALFSVEGEFFGSKLEDTKKLEEEFAEYVVEGYIMPGTSTLTNAGRDQTPLSSCAIVPVDFQERSDVIEDRIRAYYSQNMGAGFDLTQVDNPLAILSWINEFSVKETATGNYDRYIGNMGMLHVSHPHIKEFIGAKRHREMVHFNISVNVTEDFMRKAENGESYLLSNGAEIDAFDLLGSMAENAWYTGEPGLVYLDRMNRDNPVPELGEYVSTPPCAEMGLTKGETCHFGYINLRKFVVIRGESIEIDYVKLKRVTQLLTRALDNAVEHSIFYYPTIASREITQKKRKIGIGVCGLADMLIAHKLPYASSEARSLARDVLSFVNYFSKVASVELACERGSCYAMRLPKNKYVNGRILEDKYGSSPTRTVSAGDWEKLANEIRDTGKLRNITTTALPPTGRASILLGVTPSIEPIFSVFGNDGNLNRSAEDLLLRELGGDEVLIKRVRQEALQSGSFQDNEKLPALIRECLKVAKEISPKAHIQMVAALGGVRGVIDESASKTINLPNRATIDDIEKIFLWSYDLGLKNISVYRDKTKAGQPEQL